MNTCWMDSSRVGVPTDSVPRYPGDPPRRSLCRTPGRERKINTHRCRTLNWRKCCVCWIFLAPTCHFRFSTNTHKNPATVSHLLPAESLMNWAKIHKNVPSAEAGTGHFFYVSYLSSSAVKHKHNLAAKHLCYSCVYLYTPKTWRSFHRHIYMDLPPAT